jgi:hypothetical protein
MADAGGWVQGGGQETPAATRPRLFSKPARQHLNWSASQMLSACVQSRRSRYFPIQPVAPLHR